MTGAVAVVLPGEYGAAPGMVDAWLAEEPAQEVVAVASDVLGRDVAGWWRDPGNRFDPVATQLAVVVTGVAGYRSLIHRGLRPLAVAGHGVGEYAALVASGALELGQVVELVDWRAELFSLSPRPSCAGMAVLRGPGAGEFARSLVAEAGGGPLAVAAVDGPAQVVLSGSREALDRARSAVLDTGLDLVRLPGRPACHGPLMEPVAAHLSAALTDLDWSVPAVPVVSNVDGRPSREPERLAQCLRAHLTSPVQWEATSRALVEGGATSVVEVGVTAVLGPLIRQVHPALPVHLASGPDVLLPTDDQEPALAGQLSTRGET